MTNKEKILSTTLNLIINNGFHGTSMKNIVESSGISTGGVYYHFKTKDDIITQLYLSIKKEILADIHAKVDVNDPTKKFIRDFWYSKVQWAKEHQCQKRFLDMFYQSPYKHTKINEELVACYKLLVDRVKIAVDQGELIPMDCMFFFADIDASANVITDYARKRPELNEEELHEFAFKKYWRSIVNI